ncbi:colanic acid biosynthesis glycosyltransferase WcaI [Trinickia symbiotica]|uniref:Colanic acid biosynthesis glycosyltransferase WcaI n=1 Tax=Trinickia symbiotica TaxID=863227 RepID=A0A2T3XVS5_9BURK|nr:glycosyltransferase WbuB [Trinickia symbiotica]PTB20572.1 colanic acid biosynthesis glycosyltransferase WcaI [Trinickia symbiotica]
MSHVEKSGRVDRRIRRRAREHAHGHVENAGVATTPLRVLVYSLNYAPELTGVGKYSGELVESLTEHGGEAAVVAAQPYYPGWRIFDGFRNRYAIERTRPGVTVYRCPLYVPARPSGAKRLLHHASFVTATLPVMARLLVWRPDVIWVVEPSLMCAPIALAAARLVGAKCWLHVQDYEVDAAIGLGLVKSTWFKRMALGVERWLMRRFDVVSSISTKMIERAKAKGVDSRRLVSLPNWVDIAEPCSDRGDRHGGRYREALGLAAGTKVCLYAGNMGQKQGLEVMADAARRLARRTDIRFVFCGEGSGRQSLVERCAGLPNVTFLPLQPAHHLSELLRWADVHLLPQRADVADLVMPSKLAGMLASGRPIVAIAEKGTEVGTVASQCGVAVAPGDLESFIAAIEAMIDEPELASRCGMQGRQYAMANLDRRRVMERFVSSLVQLCSS